jgi:hypothetical protein
LSKNLVHLAFAVVACAAAAAAALGVATVMAWLSFFATVIGGVILATSSKRRSPLASTARAALTRPSLLTFLIPLLWALTIVIAGYAVLTQFVRQAGNIQGVVVLSDGSPGFGVHIQLDGKPATTTDADGRFSVPFKRWRVGRAKAAQITAQRGAASASEPVALTSDIVQVRLVLPAPHAAYRIVYVRAAHRTVDLFLDPPQRENWDAALGGRRFDIRNRVYESLSSLAARFTQNGSMSVYYVRGREQDDALRERLAQDPPQRRSFAGSSGVNMANYFSLTVQVPPRPSDIESLTDPSVQWLPYAKESSDPRPETKLQFRRPLQRADFARSDEPLVRFWELVTRDVLPEDFGTAQLSLESEACGDDQGWYPRMTLVGRLAVVDVAVIENTAGYPLTIGDFTGRTGSDSALRTQQHDDARLQSAQAVRESPFTIQVLNPGEKIAIPLRMLLVHPRDSYDDHLAALEPARDLASLGMINVGGQWIDLTAMSRRIPPLPSDGAYVYGPSYRLDAIEIGGEDYPVRKQPARLLVVDSGNDIGSCPFFYGWSRSERKWVSGGTILYGRRSAAQSGTDERPLHHFDGRVRIAEIEPETSFIDRVYVVAIDAAGGRTMLLPTDTRLRQTDGNHVRMTIGDEMIVNFERAPDTATSFLFGATGYYVPESPP